MVPDTGTSHYYLPPGAHRLWDVKNLIITPHDSWKTDIYWERSYENFIENAQRFISGDSLIAEVTSCVDAVSSNKALRF